MNSWPTGSARLSDILDTYLLFRNYTAARK